MHPVIIAQASVTSPNLTQISPNPDAIVEITSTAICGSDLFRSRSLEFATHTMAPGGGPAACATFEVKQDGAINVVLQP